VAWFIASWIFDVEVVRLCDDNEAANDTCSHEILLFINDWLFKAFIILSVLIFDL